MIIAAARYEGEAAEEDQRDANDFYGYFFHGHYASFLQFLILRYSKGSVHHICIEIASKLHHINFQRNMALYG